MTSVQLRHYAVNKRRRLLAAGRELGLLAVLVPAHRRDEAEQKLANALEVMGDTTGNLGSAAVLRGAVWSFDELREISPDVGDDPDVVQLAAMIAVQEALDIRPFTAAELVRLDDSRRRDLWLIADRVSAALAPGGGRLQPAGKDSDFEWRRYVELTPGGTNVAIGVRRDPSEDPTVASTSQLWLRIHRDTPNASIAMQRLEQGYPSTWT